MASTGAAIISAQGDTTGSVWAFRQTQIGGGGGGGGVTSVVQGSGITVTSSGPGGTGTVTVAATGGGGGITAVNGGTGITATTTSGVVALANTGVTSLAVAGGGITTSGSTGALTLTVPRGEAQYSLPTTGPIQQYIKLGTWTITTAGTELVIKTYSSEGQDSINDELQVTTLFIVSGVSAGPSGTFLAATASFDGVLGLGNIGGNSFQQVPYQFVIATSNSGYTLDIYGLFNPSTPAGAFYTVNNSDTLSTWVNSATLTGSSTAPVGAFRTLTVVAKGTASIWSKYPATQTVTFPNGGPNINTFNTGVAPGTNYCDFNSAPATSGVVSVIRIIGQAGSQIYLQPATIGIQIGAGGNLDITKPPRYYLTSDFVQQPVIQYGTNTAGTGAAGTVVQTIPKAYTLASTYVVQVTMRDAPTAQLYATPLTADSFTIGWTSAGAGAQAIMWTTFGT